MVRKKSHRPSLRESESALAMASLDMDISTGSQKLRPEDLLQRERPATVQDAFLRARAWQTENWFVRQINGLKLAFYNYGMRLVAVDKKQRKKLQEKLDADPTLRMAIERHVTEVWMEWILNDNVVSFWREAAAVTPFLLLGEICRYSDAMGIERLKVKMNYTREELQGTTESGGNANQEMVQRYTRGKEVLLQESKDEFFKVLTRGYRGQGFSMPGMYGIFRGLSQNDSMEVSETMLAYISRAVVRFHRLGFQLKNAGGNQATKQNEFSLWGKKRADAIQKFFQGRLGFMDATGNFDHQIELIIGGKGYDTKLYDARKWDTVITRWCWWAGPLAFMMLSKAVNPFLLPMLKTGAQEERRRIGNYLACVINAGFELGIPVKFTWSNKCFNDSRLAWDMTKQMMLQGPLSLRTALEETDNDPEVEAERKAAEAKEDPKLLLPLHDPNHGGQPGQGAGKPRTKAPSGGNKK